MMGNMTGESSADQDLLKKLAVLEKESEQRKKAEQFTQAILNSLSAHIAILNEHGVIIETNRAWKNFAKANQMRMRPDTLGINYIDLCTSAVGTSSERAQEVADGIKQVLGGLIEEYAIDYPCHSPDEKRWFYMRVTRLQGSQPLKLVVSHENITALKTTEEALRKREAELEAQTVNLHEANLALKVLVKQREEDQREWEERVLLNVRNFIIPHLEKLKKLRCDVTYRSHLDIVESHLNNIISPFLHRLSSGYLRLTPQEVQVAALVKEGKTTKAIAEILGISTDAIDFHRKNLRKKLGLTHSKANLRTHLLSLAK